MTADTLPHPPPGIDLPRLAGGPRDSGTALGAASVALAPLCVMAARGAS